MGIITPKLNPQSPLWLVGMVVGIAVIGIVFIYLNRKRTLQEKFDFPSNRKGKLVALSRN